MPHDAQRPSCRTRGPGKAFATICAFSFLLMAMGGCGLSPFGNKGAASSSSPRTEKLKTVPESLDPRNIAHPASKEEGISMDPLPPLRSPPGEADPLQSITPLEPVPGGSLGALGFNLETYFAGNLKDPNQRVERVERAVVAIQRDLRTIVPSVQRLVAIEGDIQELVAQLEIMLQTQPSASPQSPGLSALPVEMRPDYKPPPATTATHTPVPINISGGKAARSVAGAIQVQGLRLGEHKGKTRIVLDVSGPASYHYDLDNGENLLIIELPEAGWAGQRNWASGKAPLVASYSVNPMDGGKGSRLVVQLRHDASIVYEGTIAGSSSKAYRIVLDLRSAAVHK